jgi:hypothetical protein
MLRKFLCLACLLFLGVATCQFAKAGTVTDNGSIYTLSYSATSSNTFDVFLTVNTTGYNGIFSDDLSAVALQLVSSQHNSDLSSVSLLSKPSGTWSTFKGDDLGTSGCMSNGGGGFFCSETNTGLPTGSSGDIYNFEWLLTLAPGTSGDLLTGTNAAQVEALYTGWCNNQDSDHITLTGDPSVTPEPSSLLLLGTGFTGLAGLLWRKRTA